MTQTGLLIIIVLLFLFISLVGIFSGFALGYVYGRKKELSEKIVQLNPIPAAPNANFPYTGAERIKKAIDQFNQPDPIHPSVDRVKNQEGSSVMKYPKPEDVRKRKEDETVSAYLEDKTITARKSGSYAL